MTGDGGPGRALRAALRLQPGGSARADEIADVYEQATEGVGRLGRWRELFGIAGYGLRLRTGLTSAGTVGRLLAAAAPFVAGATAGTAVLQLLYYGRRAAHGAYDLPVDQMWFCLQEAGLAAGLVSAVAALAGRWAVARAGAFAGVFLVLVEWLVLGTLQGSRLVDLVLQMFVMAGPRLMWSLLLLATPPDLLAPGAWSWRRAAGVLGGVAFAGPVLEMYETALLLGGRADVVIRYGPPLLVGGELVIFLAAAVALRRGWQAPVVAAVATLPLALTIGTEVLFLFLGRGAAFLALLGLIATAVLAVGRRRAATLRGKGSLS